MGQHPRKLATMCEKYVGFIPRSRGGTRNTGSREDRGLRFFAKENENNVDLFTSFYDYSMSFIPSDGQAEAVGLPQLWTNGSFIIMTTKLTSEPTQVLCPQGLRKFNRINY